MTVRQASHQSGRGKTGGLPRWLPSPLRRLGGRHRPAPRPPALWPPRTRSEAHALAGRRPSASISPPEVVCGGEHGLGACRVDPDRRVIMQRGRRRADQSGSSRDGSHGQPAHSLPACQGSGPAATGLATAPDHRGGNGRPALYPVSTYKKRRPRPGGFVGRDFRRRLIKKITLTIDG